ncbi:MULTISPECIES: hypothetical protein [unclassified Arcicella]|uniref:hypothetical protein n=1 Tax=unclassified Arcicella TaxID=2644986 RepID=UPI002855150C|nr:MULTISPECIES: hypothetical protein [unclassified Arcicella]MDR6560313.1 hypothetical protein [Arcicella sp. BE51]MDR6810081.1 hypothetical protein [Arcicella sp. BE140]MDR6821430.1 hypothetical protein [Arcicella sp. BE139]
MTNEKFYIDKCKELIEKQLEWGDSEHWQNQDFDVLSERIFEVTKVSLSNSTLKRLWGKVRYDSTPNLTTLNALAQFIHYENWRAFTSNGFQPKIDVNEEIPHKTAVVTNTPPRSISKGYFWVIGFFMVGLLLGIWAFQHKSRPLTYGKVLFSSMPVTLGVPNTVLFYYDAKDSNADSVFIQQSWDSKLRVKVDKNKHQFANTYYLPGYYKAKLVLNDSIVKEHDLYIETDGWLRTIDKESMPVFLPKKQATKENVIAIDEEDLTGQKFDLEKNIPWVSIFKVQKDLQIPSDNFVFETDIKNTFNRGDGICHKTKIVLMCMNGAHVIPLSIKGCVGELNVVLGNELYEGKTLDLSGFGVDFSDWIHIKMEVKNREAKIFINQKLAFEGDFKQSLGMIVGLRASFKGAGEIRNAKFYVKDNKAIRL